MVKLVRGSKAILIITLALALSGCNAGKKDDVANAEVNNADVNIAVVNPWTESDEDGVREATGYSIKAPEDATEVCYSYCADDKMAQVTYVKDGTDWTYRIKATSALEDISGMYYDWIASDEGTVSGKKAVYLAYSDAEEDSEYIDNMYCVQVVNWYDAGLTYSLSACGYDLNGMDIQVYAEQIYEE